MTILNQTHAKSTTRGKHIKKYVVGFMFSTDLQFVALIRKNRPEWQAGKLNGIGGKIEDGESPRDAMVREFREETGVQTAPEYWQIKGRIQGIDFAGNEFKVYILKTVSDKCANVCSVTDEYVGVYPIAQIQDFKTIDNLQAIIPALMLPDLKGFYLTY